MKTGGFFSTVQIGCTENLYFCGKLLSNLWRSILFFVLLQVENGYIR